MKGCTCCIYGVFQTLYKSEYSESNSSYLNNNHPHLLDHPSNKILTMKTLVFLCVVASVILLASAFDPKRRYDADTYTRNLLARYPLAAKGTLIIIVQSTYTILT